MKKKSLLIFGIGLTVTFLIFTYLRKDEPRLYHITGQTMGTIVYNVKYIGQEVENLDIEISQELVDFNESLSTYIPDSEISQLNKDGSLTFRSSYFYPILSQSKEVYNATFGAFDPSIGPLVQAWGFGSNKSIPNSDSITVDSLKQIVGFNQVNFSESQVQIPQNYQLDFSAIAKGYAVDIVGELLEANGLTNYLVEIGGEVRCRGINDEGKSWSLGIEDPTVAQNEQRLMAIVRLKNKSLATSGNYRNYYEKEGSIYAHIIDPRTGYTANHTLLSASVFAEDCMTADAFATAFMVLGVERSKQVMANENIDAILLYRSDDGTIKSYITDGIRPFLEMNKAEGIISCKR